MLLPKYLVCCVFLCRLIFLSHFAIFNKKEQISINNTTILASIMKFLDADSKIIAKPMLMHFMQFESLIDFVVISFLQFAIITLGKATYI